MENYELIMETIIGYNCLYEIINTWAELPEQNGIITMPKHYNEPEPIDKENQAQLEIFWMMAVILFGDYGTSPRSGWIEHIDKFRKWVHDLTDNSIRVSEIEGEEED